MQSRTAGGARAFLHRLSGHNDDSLAVSSAGLGHGCHTGPSPSPSCAALPAILEKTLGQGEAAKAAGDINFWKHRETAMLALGTVQKSVDRMLAKRLLNFDVSGFLETVVLSDVVNPGIMKTLFFRTCQVTTRT